MLAKALNWEIWVRGATHFGGFSEGYTPYPGPSSCTQLEIQRPSPLCSVSQVPRS